MTIRIEIAWPVETASSSYMHALQIKLNGLTNALQIYFLAMRTAQFSIKFAITLKHSQWSVHEIEDVVHVKFNSKKNYSVSKANFEFASSERDPKPPSAPANETGIL